MKGRWGCLEEDVKAVNGRLLQCQMSSLINREWKGHRSCFCCGFLSELKGLPGVFLSVRFVVIIFGDLMFCIPEKANYNHQNVTVHEITCSMTRYLICFLSNYLILQYNIWLQWLQQYKTCLWLSLDLVKVRDTSGSDLIQEIFLESQNTVLWLPFLNNKCFCCLIMTLLTSGCEPQASVSKSLFIPGINIHLCWSYHQWTALSTWVHTLGCVSTCVSSDLLWLDLAF